MCRMAGSGFGVVPREGAAPGRDARWRRRREGAAPAGPSPLPARPERRPPASTSRRDRGAGYSGGQFGADALQQFLGRPDAVGLGQFVALVLDAEVAAVAGIDHDLHHLLVIGVNLVALVVEVVRLGADALGVGHHLLDALVAVVDLVAADAEV